MAYVRLRSRNANRWCKKYPFVRVEPVPVLVGDRPTWIEAVELEFNNEDSATHQFDTKFPGVPIVTCTPVEYSSLSQTAAVNLSISSCTKNAVEIESSAIFTGTVMLHAIYIG